MIIKALYYPLFRGRCPHLASGISLEILGNNTEADGIGVGWFVLSICHPTFYFTDNR